MNGTTTITSQVNETLFLYIIIGVSICFLCSSFLISFYMIKRRIKRIKKRKIELSLIDRYQDFLSNMIVLPSLTNDVSQMKSRPIMTERLQLSDITNAYNRSILIQEIYNFKSYLQGNQATQLVNYFFGLGLQEDVQKLLLSNSWTDQLMALKYVQAFDIKECLPETIKLWEKHKIHSIAKGQGITLEKYITTSNKSSNKELING